jgi:hypothetical protein
MISLIYILFYSFFNPVNHDLDAHDFHISRCEINYDKRSGDLQVAAHIFLDDLEATLSKLGKRQLFLCTPKESTDGDTAIEQYINQKLILKVGGKVIKLSLLGKETSKDKLAVWCYLEAQGLKNLSVFDIENSILTELYNDQKNIVDFTVDKKKKHFTIFDTNKVKEVYAW